jgi:hypothetical protein
MSAWQIGLVVVGILILVAAVRAEFKSARIGRRPQSSADEYGVQTTIRNAGDQGFGSV